MCSVFHEDGAVHAGVWMEVAHCMHASRGQHGWQLATHSPCPPVPHQHGRNAMRLAATSAAVPSCRTAGGCCWCVACMQEKLLVCVAPLTYLERAARACEQRSRHIGACHYWQRLETFLRGAGSACSVSPHLVLHPHHRPTHGISQTATYNVHGAYSLPVTAHYSESRPLGGTWDLGIVGAVQAIRSLTAPPLLLLQGCCVNE